MVYDGLLVLALILFTLTVFTGLNRTEAVHGPWVNATLFLEIYSFFAWFWVRRGQTIGMLAWRLQIRSDYPGPLTLAQATRRFLGALASFACLGLGHVWMLFDPGRRTWPDIFSGSRLLYVPRSN